MAKQPGYQGSTQKGTGELKSRLLFVLGALIVFRIGSFIPVPGIDASVLSELIRQQQGTIIDMFNMFSGGALSRAFYICTRYYALYFSVNYYPIIDSDSPTSS
ncbi:Protein translocase subunit SecY [Mannheimia haemolytica]